MATCRSGGLIPATPRWGGWWAARRPAGNAHPVARHPLRGRPLKRGTAPARDGPPVSRRHRDRRTGSSIASAAFQLRPARHRRRQHTPGDRLMRIGRHVRVPPPLPTNLPRRFVRPGRETAVADWGRSHARLDALKAAQPKSAAFAGRARVRLRMAPRRIHVVRAVRVNRTAHHGHRLSIPPRPVGHEETPLDLQCADRR